MGRIIRRRQPVADPKPQSSRVASVFAILKSAFLIPHRSEAVEMAVDTRRVTRNAEDAAKCVAAVDWV